MDVIPKDITVSVIIPAYGAAEYIGEALRSVLAQTYRDFEVIVINDGSPDTEQLERAIAPFLTRIGYLKQDNRGPSAARNLGIRRAQGEFLAFLDADDVWEAEYLAEQLQMFKAYPWLDMVYCDVRFFGDTPSAGKSYMELYPPESNDVTFDALLADKCPMIFPSCLVARRTTIMCAELFDEALNYSEDTDLCLRVSYGGGRIAYHRRALARRRAHARSLNANRHKVERGLIQVLSKLGSELELSPAQRGILEARVAQFQGAIHLSEGKRFLAEGRVEEARTSFASANRILRRKKLSLVLAGLRYAPGLTRWAAMTWQAVESSFPRVKTRASLRQGRVCDQ